MTGWVGDIEDATLANDTFRTVLFTGRNLQLTVMRLAPGEEIGGPCPVDGRGARRHGRRTRRAGGDRQPQLGPPAQGR